MGNGNEINEMTILISGYDAIQYVISFGFCILRAIIVIIIIIIEKKLIFGPRFLFLCVFSVVQQPLTHSLRIFIGFRSKTCDKYVK